MSGKEESGMPRSVRVLDGLASVVVLVMVFAALGMVVVGTVEVTVSSVVVVFASEMLPELQLQ